MIAVGIDPSLTSTGVAVLVDGKPVHYGRYGRPGHNGASYTTRSRRVRRMIREVTEAALTAGKPDVFVIEEHPYAVGNQGNEFDRAAVWHGIYGNLDAREIPGVVVNNTTGKAWVTGAGRASKEDVIAVIDDWYAGQLAEPLASWRKNQNPDDVADALGYATMGAFKLGDPLPFEPKERHRTALALLPWPKIATVR
ncbi:RuvC-like Holliday junction resolvase [Mycobacterium phage Sneeze]|uniref:RuvC-like resolvase n=1 Tax=Mycobacterium phage Rabbs TaxID=2530143 RepID=A0A481VSD2_9CAUD|nr:RuvC-like Holliday junction resolvase [Mycobacterium phage Sneeze]YP_010051398.1 RuvC-like Holliday junction resolvase [Mycobacterium phage Rabbs]ANU79759.1 RuvC-like resolvase [Mycobacterium phage Sneeze]QBI96804.1 RuvC-like resolvase [Mycobacterium phage Rabbs]